MLSPVRASEALAGASSSIASRQLLLGLSLILITLSLWLLRGNAPVQDRTNSYAKFFLIALRLAIGWHCFVEGMEKISTPGWSSEAYLREADLTGAYLREADLSYTNFI